MKVLGAVLALLMLSFNAHAGPSINVGVVYDYLDGDKTNYLKRVFNGGTSTAFVKITVLEIIYSADGTAEEVPLKNLPDGARDGLMASPARLIVPPNGTQSTRLLLRGERDKERYFRVRYIPVMPEKDDEFAVPEQEREAYKQTLSAGVSVLAGYGTVFFVRPKDTRFDTQIDNGQGQYQLRNNGNSVVVIDEFKDCSAKDAMDCTPVTKNHVLPGRVFSFEKKAGRVYRFQLVEGGKPKVHEVKG